MDVQRRQNQQPPGVVYLFKEKCESAALTLAMYREQVSSQSESEETKSGAKVDVSTHTDTVERHIHTQANTLYLVSKTMFFFLSFISL